MTIRRKIRNLSTFNKSLSDLRDHGIVVDADVTSLLDAAVYTDLTGRGADERMFTLAGHLPVSQGDRVEWV